VRLHLGDRVECHRPDGRPVGTWPLYEGRVGIVVVTPNAAGEVGVSWDLTQQALGNKRADAWFLPVELTVIERQSKPL